ncbi:STE/STE11 protein kinase [Ephemerocybe angulata]|uniref:STE/STE11 protein kinase n=1 Tax=Ephemerocybe angulata TaxID=980116 RepID=A0A8H6IKP0_9AGAR|nr:STE/STE11 protein kinase [Tulosesus angulatus]
MRRLNPALFPHPEQDTVVDKDDDDDDDIGSPWQGGMSEPRIYPSPSPSISTSNPNKVLRASNKSRPTAGYHPPQMPPPGSSNKYPDIYSQFVRRYRTKDVQGDFDESLDRTDPDSHYIHQGADFGEASDEEDMQSFMSGDWGSQSAEYDIETQPVTDQDRERIEWQTLLASVLSGEVLKSEKTRISVALDSQGDEHNNFHLNIWLGIRAKFHGRTVEEERRKLEEKRIRIVDAVIGEVMNFRVSRDEQDISKEATWDALNQVTAILHRLEVAQSLYPNLKAFYHDKPAAAEGAFQARCDTLNTWSTVLVSLKHHFDLLRRWTGSDTLDVTQPNTSHEVPITHGRDPSQPSPEYADGTSFVERLLKEESMQRTFEKGFLVTVHAFLGTVRDAQVNLAGHFEEMNLPTFESDLIPLISFPTKLAQAGLRLRLDYVQKLKEPDVIIIDQMIEDMKLSIGLACTLKRQYEAFLAPDPNGNWNLPQCISEDYDSTILAALDCFFILLSWKLKSGAKGIYYKETDVLEAQWATYNDVSLTAGGSSLVAEKLCSLSHKLMVRVTNYFETQLRVPIHNNRSGNSSSSGDGKAPKSKNPKKDRTPANQKMTDDQLLSWYSKILDGVRLRYRKLQRFARALTQRFTNSAEYTIDAPLDQLINLLVMSDHFLVYTQTLEEEGTYVIASGSLLDRPDYIRRILTEAFHVEEITNEDGTRIVGIDYLASDSDAAGYLLVLSPQDQFIWNGKVVVLSVPKLVLDTQEGHIRLIADGPQRRLNYAKQTFKECLEIINEDEETISSLVLPCYTETQAHLPKVNVELRRIARATTRLTESIVDSVHHVRKMLRGVPNSQDLLGNWYFFASEHGQHAHKFMEPPAVHNFSRLLNKLAISWVTFICDDCEPTDRKTFRWAVNALEFTLQRTKRNILHIPDEQFEMLRQRVASCMTLLISHFDILGARSSVEARVEKERQQMLLRSQVVDRRSDNDDFPIDDLIETHLWTEPSARKYWDRVSLALRELEETQAAIATQHKGKVLDDEMAEDRSLVFLASSSSNISIRWQQGRFIGAGAFGSVYLAMNLDSGSLMAVKEIKFQELTGLPNLYAQIKDELSVMEMLHHPNVVEYYGIEVHRDKVYIFEEFCQGGSLASLLEHGRIEEERILQIYTMQMLDGLAYLHAQGIVHRDIKPDNILLDHNGVIKFVDFGAAKILAKNQKTMQRTRRVTNEDPNAGFPNIGGLAVLSNGLTGTPMYMSPEIIKNDKRGRYGATDIWSLGCVILECATGKKPWSNLDNEWAIMFHIGVATQHPPLPEPGQLSPTGIDFITQCLTIDPMKRPNAMELVAHRWMLDVQEALLTYDETDATSPRPSAADETFEQTRMDHQDEVQANKPPAT